MSDEKKYNGLLKIADPKDENALITQKEWKQAVAAKTGLSEEQVHPILKAAQLELDPETPDGADKKVIAKVYSLAKAGFARAVVVKAENERKKAEEEAARQEAIAKMKEAGDAVRDDVEALALPLNDMVKSSIAKAVGDGFTVDKDGNFKLKKGVDPDEAFASGLNGLRRLVGVSDELKEGFAIAEARLALVAEEHYGKDWPNFFGSTDDKDVTRIKKNMKAIRTFGELGFEVGAVPIGTLRALTEVRYDKESEENNNKIKSKVIKEFLKKSKEKGKPLNQIEAKQLVSQATPERQANTVQRWNYIYLIPSVGWVGSMDFQEELAKSAEYTIDAKLRLVEKDDDGNDTYKQIPSYAAKEVTGKEETKPAKKTAAKKAAAPPPPAEEEATTEEEATEDEPNLDWL